MKKVLSSLLAVVVLVGGMYVAINSAPPKPVLTIENKTVEVAQSSYCWNGLLKTQCVDMISPPDLIEHHKITPVVVSPGADVKIKFHRKPLENTLTASIWSSNNEITNAPLNENVLSVPNEKGFYIYSLSAYWKKGSSSYVFVIEVK
ncbi:hypothetical protein MKY51_09890 [Solibacillus sp. FSL R5-0691]|uniref:hypothetical protein n=1 Tax=Solibacillus sp. FSL R5-0691 TaxID=2921653 RepID=UPI0030D4781D